MRILAVDPGTYCGFAVGDQNAVIGSGVWDLSLRRGDSPGVRYLRLQSNMQSALNAVPDIGLVIYEASFQRGSKAAEYHAGYCTRIQSWAAEKSIEHTSVFASTLKKWATGKGNASKEQMIEMGKRRFEPTSLDHNEIDALWLLEYAVRRLGVCPDSV